MKAVCEIYFEKYLLKSKNGRKKRRQQRQFTAAEKVRGLLNLKLELILSNLTISSTLFQKL